MNTVLRDADVVVVGGDAAGLLFALRAAQRFMQVVLVRDGSEVLDDGVLSLGDEAQRILESLPGTAEGTIPQLHWQWTYLSRLRRDFARVLELQDEVPFDWYDNQMASSPKQLFRAEAFHFQGDSESAKAAFEAARIELEKALEERPEDYRLYGSLGIALAGLGRKDEAIDAGRKSVEMQPVDKEAYIGPMQVENLALIYTRVGELELAIV